MSLTTQISELGSLTFLPIAADRTCNDSALALALASIALASPLALFIWASRSASEAKIAACLSPSARLISDIFIPTRTTASQNYRGSGICLH